MILSVFIKISKNDIIHNIERGGSKMSMIEKFRKANFSKRIAALRALAGWSMNDAARRCGTSQRVYWNWENGKATPRKIFQKKIACVYNVDIKDIFGNEDTL